MSERYQSEGSISPYEGQTGNAQCADLGAEGAVFLQVSTESECGPTHGVQLTRARIQIQTGTKKREKELVSS